MEHTLEKWETHPVTEFNVVYAVIDGEAQEICRTPGIWPNDKANARRIVAAVNAVEGIETELLERLPQEGWKSIAAANLAFTQQLEAQNAQLLQALKNLNSRAARDAEIYAPEGNEPIWAFIQDAADAIAETETTDHDHTQAKIKL